MSVCYGVIVRILINQRCVCVSSGVLMSFAPCDPGPRVLSPLCRSTSCAGISDGAVPRRLCGQNPLQDLPGHYPRSVQKSKFGWGLKSLSPAARTVNVGVVLDGPDGVLRAPGKPGNASGILAGLFWPHRRSVERPTYGHWAIGF